MMIQRPETDPDTEFQKQMCGGSKSTKADDLCALAYTGLILAVMWAIYNFGNYTGVRIPHM